MEDRIHSLKVAQLGGDFLLLSFDEKGRHIEFIKDFLAEQDEFKQVEKAERLGYPFSEELKDETLRRAELMFDTIRHSLAEDVNDLFNDSETQEQAKQLARDFLEIDYKTDFEFKKEVSDLLDRLKPHIEVPDMEEFKLSAKFCSGIDPFYSEQVNRSLSAVVDHSPILMRSFDELCKRKEVTQEKGNLKLLSNEYLVEISELKGKTGRRSGKSVNVVFLSIFEGSLLALDLTFQKKSHVAWKNQSQLWVNLGNCKISLKVSEVAGNRQLLDISFLPCLAPDYLTNDEALQLFPGSEQYNFTPAAIMRRLVSEYGLNFRNGEETREVLKTYLQPDQMVGNFGDDFAKMWFNEKSITRRDYQSRKVIWDHSLSALPGGKGKPFEKVLDSSIELFKNDLKLLLKKDLSSLLNMEFSDATNDIELSFKRGLPIVKTPVPVKELSMPFRGRSRR